MSLVSILIPTYNQPEFFRLTLESALAQDYPEIEILVSDDSTDDRVEKVAMEYRDYIQFFKHHKTRNSKLGFENMMFLLNHAHGEFINFLFHDDLFMPQKISTMMQYFTDDVAFVTSVRYVIDEHGNVLQNIGLENMNSSAVYFTCEEIGQNLLLRTNNFIGELTTVLMRREDLWCEQNSRYEICRFMDLSRMIANCDVPTYLEICRQNPDKKCIFVNKPLSAFRRHFAQNERNFNVIMDTLFEWIAMIRVAYRSKVFITNEYLLREFCRNFLQIAMRVIKNFADFDGLDSIHAQRIDLLIQIINACENNDLDLFLKLSNGSFVE